MSICVEGATAGERWLWGAPVYDQVRNAWDETSYAAREVAEFVKGEMIAQFPGGGRILFRSLDNPDTKRGFTADGIVIDEAGDVSQAAWYEALRPTLMDTGGGAWIIGTPKGQNWFWRECLMAQEREDSRFWNAPTLGVEIMDTGGLRRVPHPLENPYIAFSELKQLYRTLPERVFRQEILAEFLEESGGVFRGIREVIDVGRSTNEAAGSGCMLGVDLARVQDFTVLTVLDADRRQVYHERFNQISWERQIATITRVCQQYGKARIWMDSTGVGDPIFEALRNAQLPVQGYNLTNQSKEALIDALALAIENRQVRLMDLPTQTAELQAFQYELTPSRNVRMSAPEGMHDDCVIALALANWGLAAKRTITFR